MPWQYSDGNPLTGALKAGGILGYKKSLFSTSISLHRGLSMLRPSVVINTVPSDRGKFVTLIAGISKRRSLLMAGDDDEVCMTRSLNVTPKTTEQHLIVRSDNSEAEVTKECARGTVLLKQTSDRHETSRGLSATTELCVLQP